MPCEKWWLVPVCVETVPALVFCNTLHKWTNLDVAIFFSQMIDLLSLACILDIIMHFVHYQIYGNKVVNITVTLKWQSFSRGNVRQLLHPFQQLWSIQLPTNVLSLSLDSFKIRREYSKKPFNFSDIPIHDLVKGPSSYTTAGVYISSCGCGYYILFWIPNAWLPPKLTNLQPSD